MDFAQAKIHSLVMLATSEASSSEGASQPDDPERMKFKEVESTFMRRFSMPQEEKLVNCKWSSNAQCVSVLLSFSYGRLWLQLLEKCPPSPRMALPFC